MKLYKLLAAAILALSFSAVPAWADDHEGEGHDEGSAYEEQDYGDSMEDEEQMEANSYDSEEASQEVAKKADKKKNQKKK